MRERRRLDEEHARDRHRSAGAAAKGRATRIHPSLRRVICRAPLAPAREAGRVVARDEEVFRSRAAEELDHAAPIDALRASPRPARRLPSSSRTAGVLDLRADTGYRRIAA